MMGRSGQRAAAAGYSPRPPCPWSCATSMTPRSQAAVPPVPGGASTNTPTVRMPGPSISFSAAACLGDDIPAALGGEHEPDIVRPQPVGGLDVLRDGTGRIALILVMQSAPQFCRSLARFVRRLASASPRSAPRPPPPPAAPPRPAALRTPLSDTNSTSGGTSCRRRLAVARCPRRKSFRFRLFTPMIRAPAFSADLHLRPRRGPPPDADRPRASQTARYRLRVSLSVKRETDEQHRRRAQHFGLVDHVRVHGEILAQTGDVHGGGDLAADTGRCPGTISAR